MIDDAGFEQLALEVFRRQYQQVELYRTFCDSLKRTPAQVQGLADIPFLPVEFFKSYRIISGGKETAVTFESSGTTGSVPSRHYVADTGLYERSFLLAFQQFYGQPGIIPFWHSFLLILKEEIPRWYTWPIN